MNDAAIGKGNWAIGDGANIAVVDDAKMNAPSASLDRDAYVFVYGEHGLITAVSLQGSNISQIKP